MEGDRRAPSSRSANAHDLGSSHRSGQANAASPDDPRPQIPVGRAAARASVLVRHSAKLTPVTPYELCVGLIGFPFAFAAVRACFYLVVSAAFFHLDVPHTNWIGLALVLVASGVAIAPIGILAGAAVLTVKRGDALAATLMYLMAIIAGMVFPVAVLPSWLQALARLVPLTYAFNGARDALFTGSGWETDLLVLLAWAAVLWPVALLVFARAFTYSKRAGSLAQY